MQTECSKDFFGFAPVEGREVVAAFDGGAITSDAGALLLGATDRAIGMMQRFAACFHDERQPHLIEHEVVTLVGQRVFAIALGYEDLNDHDQLRHDPMMAVLAGKLEARREDCAPVAGKSTLNRLERRCSSRTATTRSATIRSPSSGCWSISSWMPISERPAKLSLTLMPPMIRCTAIRRDVMLRPDLCCCCSSEPKISAISSARSATYECDLSTGSSGMPSTTAESVAEAAASGC
jgi:hypothetical protein